MIESVAPALNNPGPALALVLMVLALRLHWRGRALVAVITILATYLALAVFLPIPPHADFEENLLAARALYSASANPYMIPGAISFPVPTYTLYWQLGGLLPDRTAWLLWAITSAGLWLFCAINLWKLFPPTLPLQRDLQRIMLLAMPGGVVLWQGQTALWALTGVVILLTYLEVPALAGAGLALALLVKPQLALVCVGILVWALYQRRAHGVKIVAWSAVWVLTTIGVTLILPGGITLETYRTFFLSALPNIATGSDLLASNASPAYFLAAQFGISATLTSLVLLAQALTWTVQRRHAPLAEVIAGWLVWAMLIPRIAWLWYAMWCAPFFVRSLRTHPRATLFVVGLMNAQVYLTALALVQGLALLGLLLISFPIRGYNKTHGLDYRPIRHSNCRLRASAAPLETDGRHSA